MPIWIDCIQTFDNKIFWNFFCLVDFESIYSRCLLCRCSAAHDWLLQY